MKKVVFLGLGYIGLPTAAVAAGHGYEVVGVDVNPSVVETINQGKIHIVEPELDQIVKEVVRTGNLRAVSKPEQADAFFVVVPTPFKQNHRADITYVESATRSVIPYLREGNLFVIESTSPVFTTERMAEVIYKERPELKDKKIVGILIENDLTGSQISQSIVGIGININQEEFHSSAPNPVSLRQITQKETDRMEVLNSVLEHIINLYSRIENRETDIITKIQEYYLKAQYRKEGYHPYCDAKGEFTAKLIRVEPDGHLILKDKNGSLRKYAFKEVKYLL